MKRFIVGLFTLIATCMITTSVYAAAATFSWTPNTESNLAGYKIYSGSSSGDYNTTTDVGNPVAIDGVIYVTIEGYIPGTQHFFAATAYDTDGFESLYSTEIEWVAPENVVLPPQPGEVLPAVPGLMVFPATRNADGTYTTDANGILVVTTPVN